MYPTRRDLLAGVLGIGGAAQFAEALQHAHQAVQNRAGFETLSPEMAKEVEALTSQILPSDDGPGAREAGVVYFIDRALMTFDQEKKAAYLSGMAEVEALRARMFPASAIIVALSDEQQKALMRGIENTPFFEILRTHTVLGFLGSPSYGGNRSGVGWSYIGFEDRMAFESPFGFYDAEVKRGGA